MTRLKCWCYNPGLPCDVHRYVPEPVDEIVDYVFVRNEDPKARLRYECTRCGKIVTDMDGHALSHGAIAISTFVHGYRRRP